MYSIELKYTCVWTTAYKSVPVEVSIRVIIECEVFAASRKLTDSTSPASLLIIRGPKRYCTMRNMGGGVSKMADVSSWYGTLAIEFCLYFNLAGVFSSTYFRFCQVQTNY
jgi:hypothetical protein